MYTSVAEPVDVLVAFKRDTVEPMTFKWGNRYYQVRKVNLVHSERKGRDKITYFSVSDEANAYRLAYSSETMKWSLEEMAVL